MTRVFIAALAVAALTPAAFHLKLLKSEPAEGAALTRAPAAVRLWFSQRAEVAVTRVRLVGPRGPVDLGPLARGDGSNEEAPPGEVRRMPVRPGRSDDAVSAPVRGTMAPGAYTIEWRTMAADGHPVAGKVAFRVTAPPAPPAPPR